MSEGEFPAGATLMMNPRLFSFCAGAVGLWQVREIFPVRGATLPSAERLETVAGNNTEDRTWILRGATSNERYVTRDEKAQLAAKQEGLGRDNSIYAALIPIKKTVAWWALTQEERRGIFEEQGKHTQTGLKYLPAIARRLHHCRDLTTAEPFDFLTWFEYGPEDEAAFDQLLGELRSSPEWDYVEREVDVRLQR